MAKFQSPLLGYNNNVRYQGRVFHIQTEDSGVNHPHIITHLFMDGGRILKSVKTSYAEHVGADGMNETVRVMMKDQHKAMIVALKEGQFDALLDIRKKSSNALDSAGSSPKVAAQPAPGSAAAVPAAVVAPAVVAPAVGPAPTRQASPPFAAVSVSAEQPAVKRVAPAPPAPLVSLGEDPPLPPELEALLRDELTPPTPERVAPVSEAKRTPSVRELTLDFDALERDAADGSVFKRENDLPPPPRTLFAKEPRTAPYRAIEDAGHVPANRIDVSPSRVPPAPQPRTATMRPRPKSSPPAAPVPDSRSAFRNAPSFAAGPTSTKTPASLFSDELVSDKSLDEVILSYLAEDLEASRRK